MEQGVLIFSVRNIDLIKLLLGGSPGLVVIHVPKVVSLNPGTIYWIDIFSRLFVVKIVICVWKDENKWKRGRGTPILKK